MKRTILIPMYNESAILPDTLARLSAFARDRFGDGDYEILLVDDGSTDGSPDLAEAYPDARVRLLRSTKDSHEFIREKGVSCMHRDIIISEQLFKKCCDFIDPTLFDMIVNAPAPLQAKLTQNKIVEFEKSFSERFFVATEKSY